MPRLSAELAIKQPVNKIKWVKRDDLTANSYNPNHVASSELALLKLSILADGWTSPIVALSNNEIVDGYHRWLIAEDLEIATATNGLVPVVYLRDDLSIADQMASTIRHNRARGTHGVVSMAHIVRAMIEAGQSPRDIMEALGMEDEEVERLIDSSGMPYRMEEQDFGKGWVPVLPQGDS